MNKRLKISPTNSRATGKAKTSQVDHVEDRRNGLTQDSITPRTAMGRRLYAIRQRIVASGQPLLDWRDIENEVRDRRREAIPEQKN
jgi:hypothetical protein